MQKLGQAALDYLSALTYRPGAARLSSLLPLSGIYWEDEIPDLVRLMHLPEQELMQVYRLFHIRFKLWANEPLSFSDEEFWHDARSRVPRCPLFMRLHPSADDLRANDEAARIASEELAALFKDAAQVSISEDEHGVQRFSATFDLAKQQPSHHPTPWWKRIFPGLVN